MQRRIISCATWARRQQKPPPPPKKKTDGISDDSDNGENLARLIRRGVCVVLYSRVPSSLPPRATWQVAASDARPLVSSP